VSAAVVIDSQGHLRGMVSYVDILRAAKGKLR
jgi:CBS domain-containing protein